MQIKSLGRVEGLLFIYNKKSKFENCITTLKKYVLPVLRKAHFKRMSVWLKFIFSANIL